jgi:hypothetical protein
LQGLLDPPPLASSQQSFVVAPWNNFAQLPNTQGTFTSHSNFQGPNFDHQKVQGFDQGSKVTFQNTQKNFPVLIEDQAFQAPQLTNSLHLFQNEPIHQTTPLPSGFRAPRKLQVNF